MFELIEYLPRMQNVEHFGLFTVLIFRSCSFTPSDENRRLKNTGFTAFSISPSLFVSTTATETNYYLEAICIEVIVAFCSPHIPVHPSSDWIICERTSKKLTRSRKIFFKDTLSSAPLLPFSRKHILKIVNLHRRVKMSIVCGCACAIKSKK